MKMKTGFRSVLVVAILCGAAFGQAAPPAQTPPTISSVMDRQLKNVEGEFVSAADAMPEEKWSFAPTNGEFKGVRNFSQQVRHVAATNYLIFAAILGEKPPADTPDDNGPQSLKTKAELMKYLRDSFAYGHKAFARLDAQSAISQVPSPFGGSGKPTLLGLATMTVGHCFDHYGQMVEYLRMNGIVPPASRQ
jgi:uncharacterized damage-inducible protein DinB